MADIAESRALLESAKAIYELRLRPILERDHKNQYVAIEPVSGNYYIGATMGDAIDKALEAHPDCITHTIRIGHAVAIEIGRIV